MTERIPRKIAILRAGTLLLLFFILLLLYSPASQNWLTFQKKNCPSGLLCVVFLDVGQGDATLIVSPDGTQVLVDGGPGPAVLRELGKAMGFFDRDIDMIVATHPDKDHIGGLIDVLRRYDVHTILVSGNESETAVSDLFNSLAEDEGASQYVARTSQQFDLGGPILSVLFPDRDAGGLESNTASIVLKLNYGETDFIFTGDAPQAIEEYLVSVFGESLESKVLKVGHHGSKTSTAETFVSAVHPTYAIISAGKDNPYGHPHQETLATLQKFGIETKSTAGGGGVMVVSNGIDVVLSE